MWVSDLIGKLELIGEWADGALEMTEDHRMLDMNALNETIRKRVYEIDLQFLLAGLMTFLGIHRLDDEPWYYLEVHVPLFLEEGMEYDLSLLERRARALKELRDRGFYLEGERGGFVKCYKEGPAAGLEGELDSIEDALAG